MNATALFQTGLTGVTPAEVALCMLMAFVLGKVVAFTYEWSYEGLSYSRTFVQSLVLGPMVAFLPTRRRGISGYIWIGTFGLHGRRGAALARPAGHGCGSGDRPGFAAIVPGPHHR